MTFMKFIIQLLLCFVFIALSTLRFEPARAAEGATTQDPPCQVPVVQLYKPVPARVEPPRYDNLDNVLLDIHYPETKDSEGNPLIAGVSVPAPLHKKAVTSTAIRIMKESGLMTCLKKTPEEPLRDPILVNSDDQRSAQPQNLTAIVVVQKMLPNFGHEHAPYFLIRANTFRPDAQFMTPGWMVNYSLASPIFFIGKSDEEIQKELERALSRVGIWPSINTQEK
jgi:hypothetical protein